MPLNRRQHVGRGSNAVAKGSKFMSSVTGGVSGNNYGNSASGSVNLPSSGVCDDSKNGGIKSNIHATLPELPKPMGELFYECTLFLYSAMALFWQYWNLYKALWWVPKAYLNYYAKLHLMDPYVLSCVGLILGRRVTWCFFKSIPEIFTGETGERKYMGIEWMFKLSMLSVVICSFSVNFHKVLCAHSFQLLLSLILPVIVVYIVLFYQDFALSSVSSIPVQLMNWLVEGPRLVDISSVRHACSVSPEQIRCEVDLLRTDFLQRMKQSIFSAFTVAHFAIYVPCNFTPKELYVDWWWMTELWLVVFLTAFSLYLAYLFPLQYCHLLHQAASHLGSWTLVTPTPSASPSPTLWSEWTLYSEGQTVSVTKGGGDEDQQGPSPSVPAECYRAVGPSVAANPTNLNHFRFQKIGTEPVRVLNWLCMLQGGLITINFFMLVHSTEWQHICTLTSLIPANYIALFFVFKDKVILGRVYNPNPQDLQS